MGVNEFIKIGTKIKECRLAKGIKQKDMADRLKIPASTYANYENDHREPPVEIIQEIASILEVSVISLMDLEKQEKESRDCINFIKYLESSGYVIKPEKIGESKEGYWEEPKEGNVVIGKRIWIPNEEYYDVTLIKDEKSVIFTDNEFKQLQLATKDVVDTRFYKKLLEQEKINKVTAATVT